MSGGIAQLVAVGAQDVHLVGDPQVSFFRSTYKRHTNFSQTVERQVIQGNVSNNGMSTIRFERKGDMLNYVYLMPIAGDGLSANTFTDNWTDVISKVELLIGGQVIDEQDSTYSTLIAPTLRRSLLPSRRRPASMMAPVLPSSTLSASPSVRTGSRLSLSSPSSTTMSSFASLGVPRLPRASGRSTPTTRTSILKSVRCSLPSPRT